MYKKLLRPLKLEVPTQMQIGENRIYGRVSYLQMLVKCLAESKNINLRQW